MKNVVAIPVLLIRAFTSLAILLITTQCDRRPDAHEEATAAPAQKLSPVDTEESPATPPAEEPDQSGTRLETLTDGVLSTAKRAGDGLREATRKTAATRSQAWATAKEQAKSASRELHESSGPLIDASKERASALWETTKEQAGDVSTRTREGAEEAWQVATEKTGITKEQAEEAWRAAREKVDPTVETLKDKAAELLKDR